MRTVRDGAQLPVEMENFMNNPGLTGHQCAGGKIARRSKDVNRGERVLSTFFRHRTVQLAENTLISLQNVNKRCSAPFIAVNDGFIFPL